MTGLFPFSKQADVNWCVSSTSWVRARRLHCPPIFYAGGHRWCKISPFLSEKYSRSLLYCPSRKQHRNYNSYKVFTHDTNMTSSFTFKLDACRDALSYTTCVTPSHNAPPLSTGWLQRNNDRALGTSCRKLSLLHLKMLCACQAPSKASFSAGGLMCGLTYTQLTVRVNALVGVIVSWLT